MFQKVRTNTKLIVLFDSRYFIIEKIKHFTLWLQFRPQSCLYLIFQNVQEYQNKEVLTCYYLSSFLVWQTMISFSITNRNTRSVLPLKNMIPKKQPLKYEYDHLSNVAFAIRTPLLCNFISNETCRETWLRPLWFFWYL